MTKQTTQVSLGRHKVPTLFETVSIGVALSDFGNRVLNEKIRNEIFAELDSVVTQVLKKWQSKFDNTIDVEVVKTRPELNAGDVDL